MSQVSEVYGGDEINAVVLDPGSRWTRVGFSAEDAPSVSVSTDYASREGSPVFGDEHTRMPKANTEIKNPFSDGLVEDWDAAKGLWSYTLSQYTPQRDLGYLTESPLLITEPVRNGSERQRQQMQYALEELNSPAMYIAKAPVLALFSAGRGTGLVVDVGAQACSVTPVVDGFCLYKAAKHSSLAGDFLSEQVRSSLKEEYLVPGYEIKSKTLVESGEAEYTKRELVPGITDSFRRFQQMQVIDNFKEQIVQVRESSKNEEPVNTRRFEFATGLSVEFGAERFDLGEKLFDGPEGLSQLIINSLKECDVDSRANLANNIVITGGTSLVQGLTERVNQDLQREFPMMKIRILASGNLVERRNAAWIGGGILSSLGTFHQMWVTRQEFEEVGPDQISAKRFR